MPQFLNVLFPLDYPSIAPFYTNVDTTNAPDGTSISYFQTQSPDQLSDASNLIRNSFSSGNDFNAENIIVVTWDKVGRYREQNSIQNTFQVNK